MLEVAPEHAGARTDLEDGARPDGEHDTDLVPVRHPAFGVVVALEVVVLGRDLHFAHGSTTASAIAAT